MQIKIHSNIRIAAFATAGALTGELIRIAIREGVLFLASTGGLYTAVSLLTAPLPLLITFLVCRRLLQKLSDSIIMVVATAVGEYVGSLGIGAYYFFTYGLAGMERMGGPDFLTVAWALPYGLCVFLFALIGTKIISGLAGTPPTLNRYVKREDSRYRSGVEK